MPQVLNKRTDRIPSGAIYVGRPSRWGNPFKIGQKYNGVILTRKTAIRAYEDWLLYSDEGVKLQEAIEELKEKDLVCWCAPLSCHADTLLKLANGGRLEC